MYYLILHGRKSITEIQKWRHLSVSVKLVENSSSFSNSFSTATSANVIPRDSRKGQSFTVSYLVDSLALSTKLAESISRRVSFEEKGNPDCVLNLLRSHGFTGSQISSITTDYPGLLIADAEKSLGPKLKFLQSRGASTSELTDILSAVPKILGMKGDKTMSRYYDMVKAILRDEEEEADDSMISPQGKQENKIRNVWALRGLGVPRSLLFTLLNSHSVQPLYGKEKFEESLKKVVEMGFDPTTPKFVNALGVIYRCKKETIEEKVNLYNRLGFAVDDVWAIFKKWPMSLTYSEKKILNSIDTFLGFGFSRAEFVMTVKRFPACIGYSAESVKKKIEFLVKKMNWPLKEVVSHPQVLGNSMEKRIVPRCNVIKALMRKGLLGNELPPMQSALKSTDEAFLNRYELVPELLAIFNMKEEKSI